jgi:DNA-binding NtrC family response regulator
MAAPCILDEVADMPRETQSRILRVLVEQRFRRVGGDNDVQVDVRVVSSTSRDLREEIAIGRFREDLFHRLNVVPVRVPGLAERREDIPELVSPLHRADQRGHRHAARPPGRGRHRHPAGPRMAWQCPPAA